MFRYRRILLAAVAVSACQSISHPATGVDLFIALCPILESEQGLSEEQEVFVLDRTRPVLASSEPVQNYDPKEIVLHMDYRSGGDAPLAFNLTILDDGRMRFLSPRGKEKWSKLDGEEQARVDYLLQNSQLGMLADAGKPFACCDFQELGVYIAADRPPIPVRFGEDPLPEEIRDFLVFINELGRHHFGRSYSLPLPVGSARQ